MQLGFVLDQSRCIGCHACTVACKSENDVPVGKFRTWVKYTEEGEFPQVRRSFTVLRCNQCTEAPCVEICPVTALEKRPDGIVDIDPAVCIGCKACMQACPYDALYLNETTGTAQKCHFCAHRTEQGLAPACAVVCPTEAIIPGDFDDPDSVVSRLKRDHRLQARKTEAGTGPNVFYKSPVPAGLDPQATHAAGGYLWSNPPPGFPVAVHEMAAMEGKAKARTTYDIGHPPMWGWKVSAYLFTKSLAAGIPLAAMMAIPAVELAATAWIPLVAMFFLAVTAVLLVADLKRPERFLSILLRPQWRSWLCKGAVILTAYGVFLAAWAGGAILGIRPPALACPVLTGIGTLLAVLTAGYTARLFGQAKGRVLWMKRGLFAHLSVQAIAAGAAFLLSLPAAAPALRIILQITLGAHMIFLLAEWRLAPRGREEEYRMAVRLVSHGPFAARHWGLGVGVGCVITLALLNAPWGAMWILAGVFALAGLLSEEDIFIRAGQALPIS